MKKFTILRTGLVQIIFLWLCSLSALAQVPSAMDYQVMATNPKTGQVLANKELLLKVEIRLNSEDGETIWSKEEKLTSSKSGICTMSLDLANIDWTLGSYYVKAFIDGEPIGASQIKSVPFALVADGINGVITKHKLVGTWVNTTVGGKVVVDNVTSETITLRYDDFKFTKNGSEYTIKGRVLYHKN